MSDKKQRFPLQRQDGQPGVESKMRPRPDSGEEGHKGCGKLPGKVALISGGDSGIGRAVAIAFAKEGANVAILYLREHGDAKDTQQKVEATGRRCIILAGDVGEEAFCEKAVQVAMNRFGRLDILVNNAAEQYPQDSLAKISKEQLERTFRTNIFSVFYLTKAALPHLKRGGTYHQYHLGDCVPRQSPSDRLLRDQGRHRGLHPVVIARTY